ncbi:maestro heat-like repeat-containing protein family member 1 [Vespa crabro]|uniref:maestro heat-like repeat-containing protein family member 1 n=1 Tax=Vespa crabro TaxID=7445 RepID=UPI001F027A87|nr:maestro heat-like repeat-containing protein family member 1 [Vespa crabro]XP_046813256.1 maestro heat-like repeat-containing protein family member 1 [Vespa crabro]
MKEEIENSCNSELPAVIGALLDTLDDKSVDVRQSVNGAIKTISEQNPEVVIHAAVYFWELHRKISSEHMASLLTVMSETCQCHGANLNTDLASSVAELAVNELFGNAEKEAVELLISLSQVHCTQAIGGLLTKLEPGILPYPTVVRTIGMIAERNPCAMISFFKITLTIMIPMLNQTRDEILKQAFCLTFGKIAEAINDHILNLDKDSSPEISKETFKEEICSAFDILTFNWIKTSKDCKSVEAVLSAIVYMIPLLPQEVDCERIIKLTPMLLNFCKKVNTRLAAVRVLAVVLSCATENEKEALRSLLEHIHQVLSELVCIIPFEASRDVLLTHYQVLQCYRSLIILYPEEGLERILQQLKSTSVSQKARVLVVLKHLINTLPSEDDTTLQRIALSLQDSLGDSSALQMVGAIVTLAARPTVPLLPSQRAIFVRYMITHCGVKNDESEAYAEALHLLATTVEGAESWLWPCLIRALLDPACVSSVASILRALAPLAVKIVNNGNSSINQRDFPGTKILGRCLELLRDVQNRLPIVTFLKCAAPLLGHQLMPYWDEKLKEITQFLRDDFSVNIKFIEQRNLNWEEKMVEFLEESVKLEGEAWSLKLADELAVKASIPHVAPLLASMCSSNAHITLLIELARSDVSNEEFARAVGICSKRHLDVVIKLMEEACMAENTRKIPVRLLGFVKDSKAIATAEAAKAGLLRCYAEIAQRGDVQKLYPSLEKNILPWIIRQINDSKELTTKEVGLLALEQVANAVHPNRFEKPAELHGKSSGLAILLGILQTSSGYRPLQLYPKVLKTIVSLVRIPPQLNSEERGIVLSTILDKVIGASTEVILLLQSEFMQQVIDELGIVCSEIVSDSADALADLIDIMLPWMQSKSTTERKTTLLVLRTTLRSYYNSLKYTYPGGKLEPGRLMGRVLSWCADSEHSLRPIAIDCVALSLNIGARHRALSPDNNLDKDLHNSKKIIVGEDPKACYDGIKILATAVSERINSGDIISLAEGLIEGLLFRGEASFAASIALSQHFKIKGSEISISDITLVDSIIAQMKQMEDSSYRRNTAIAIKFLMEHHPEEVIERLLCQPLPLDRGSEECWKALGVSLDLGSRALEFLLTKLANNNLFAENATVQTAKNGIASFPSLAAIVALRHLLQSPNSKELVNKQLSNLLSVLLKYLAGWLHVDAPVCVISTKFGYVPNREGCRINPHTEAYSVLVNVLTVVDSNIASSLLNENIFSSEAQAEESVVATVRTMMRCIYTKNNVLSTLTQSLGKMMTSTISAQRAVAATFYSELIGKVNYDVIWLDAIINTLYEAKADSSPLVRKLATIGLARIAYLEPKQVDEYFDNCMDALLDGLEESATGDGGNDVILESLRGLSVLLSVQFGRSVSPRVVLALKPFIEKENWEMRLAAISALSAVACSWQKMVTSPDDDIKNHLLGCLPCLTIRLEDENVTVAKIAQEALHNTARLLQCQPLFDLIHASLGLNIEFNFEKFISNLIHCLQKELPQRAEELRNAVVRGYSRSENSNTRATSALLLGYFGSPRPEDIQRLLQLLRDTESIVRKRAAYALSLCFVL